jgi:hypothetical protein
MNKIIIFVAVVLLTGCNLGSLSELGAQPGDVLLQEDFSNPASGWQQISTEIGMMDYFDGFYRIVVNESDYDLWSLAGGNYHDVQVEVDAASLGGPTENRFGLVCRYNKEGDYYFFIISSDGYYAIGKKFDSITSLIGQPMMAFSPTILTGIAPNHLRFDCSGSTLIGYVNGQMVAFTEEATINDGKVGIIAGSFLQPGVDVVFDNFTVIKP